MGVWNIIFMIRKIYFTDLRGALKASFSNKIACYVNPANNKKLWMSKGVVIYLE